MQMCIEGEHLHEELKMKDTDDKALMTIQEVKGEERPMMEEN